MVKLKTKNFFHSRLIKFDGTNKQEKEINGKNL